MSKVVRSKAKTGKKGIKIGKKYGKWGRSDKNGNDDDLPQIRNLDYGCTMRHSNL